MLSFKPQIKKIIIILQLILAGCSGLEKSEREKVREQNAHGEYIIRREGEVTYTDPSIRPKSREAYPWEATN